MDNVVLEEEKRGRGRPRKIGPPPPPVKKQRSFASNEEREEYYRNVYLPEYRARKRGYIITRIPIS